MSNKINEIREYISNPTDGPITDFVLISRAVTRASMYDENPEDIANALYEEMVDRGFLTSQGPR